MSLVVLSVTATEFSGGAFELGQEVRPGMVSHHPAYVGSLVLRALRTGEAGIDIARGPERPELATDPEVGATDRSGQEGCPMAPATREPVLRPAGARAEVGCQRRHRDLREAAWT